VGFRPVFTFLNWKRFLMCQF